MKLDNLSLLQKALIGVLLILFPLSISFFHSYFENRKELMDQTLDDLTVAAEAYEGQVYLYLEMVKRRARDFATGGTIVKRTEGILKGNKRDAELLAHYLKTYKLPLDKYIDRIDILSIEGKVLASTKGSQVGADLSGERFLIKGREAAVVDERYKNRDYPEIIAAAPIRDPETGKVVGVMAVSQHLSDLSRLLTGEFSRELGAITWSKGKRKTMEVYLVNRDRLMITDSIFIKDSVLRQQVTSEPVIECLEHGRELMGFYKDYRGVQVAGASMCLPSMQWVLLTEVDSEEILEPVAHIAKDAVFGAVTAAGLIGLLFIFFYRNVVSRLGLLSRASARIAAGDYDIEVPASSNDELGVLSRSFNRMSSEIRARTMLLKESEEKYRSLISHIPDITWTATRDGRVVFTSDNVTEITGYRPEEIYSNPATWSESVHPRDREMVFSAYERLFTEDSAFEEEYRFRRKDGGWIWVFDRAHAHYQKGGTMFADGVLTDITGRKLAETERQEAQQRYEDLLNSITVGVYRESGQDGEGVFIEVNKALVQMLEASSRDDVIGWKLADLFVDKSKLAEIARKIDRYGFVRNEEAELATLKGKRIWVSASAVRKTGGEECVDGIFEDITERRKLEEQLQHSQKLEAVGQLAGGIAHDFNNILTAIIGYGNLLLLKRGGDGMVRTYADHMLTLAEKATNLTQSLLAFSRKQVLNSQPVDLNDLVRRLEKILVRLIGEDIQLKSAFSEGELMVKADPVQMEQVLMNLATNARDAMSGGGALGISTGLAELGPDFIAAHGYGEPGQYALIAVSDTGEGMSEVVRKRIFEPFFTTKEVGKGTGLGLSVVYGIIKQHNGYINVYSVPDKGSTFRIYLPIIESGERSAGPEASVDVRGGTETILLAEDEEEVRSVNRSILEEFGYKVIEAVDGEDAVKRALENGGIDLLILDMVMPRKSGKEAYDEIAKARPGIKTLFTSGYAADLMEARGLMTAGAHFVAKPVSPGELLKTVREILDR